MGRRAREISETGLYHIVFRGINKQHIFEESVDYNKMKSILKEIIEEMKFEIYVYCFMTNHVRPLLSKSQMGNTHVSEPNKAVRVVANYLPIINLK